jgi:hypothetical protein
MKVYSKIWTLEEIQSMNEMPNTIGSQSEFETPII